MYIEMQEIKENMAINHEALFDGYKQTYEKLTVLEKKVDEIDKKLKNRMLK